MRRGSCRCEIVDRDGNGGGTYDVGSAVDGVRREMVERRSVVREDIVRRKIIYGSKTRFVVQVEIRLCSALNFS